MKSAAIILGAVVIMAGTTFVARAEQPTASQERSVKTVDVNNKICPVSGRNIEASGMGGATAEYKGKTYHFCCGGCLSTFNADPAKYSKIADDEVKIAQGK